ncbi:hypothetical protein CASFOL_011722 [Castilleja foliolosa]|uniref:Uncharacterized protein n=1 Tax=Castilleja foliolosa TaxID=1961234 RepID=A0ABD3DTT1_9LAMI
MRLTRALTGCRKAVEFRQAKGDVDLEGATVSLGLERSLELRLSCGGEVLGSRLGSRLDSRLDPYSLS